MDYQRLQSAVPNSSGKPTVLVVEDQVDLRDAIAVLLEAEGYTVVDAENGREALKLLKTGTNVAAIVLDLLMPVMDGWQFLAERRRNPKWLRIPTIVVTGISESKRRQKDLGEVEVFTKPFHFDELFAALRKSLR